MFEIIVKILFVLLAIVGIVEVFRMFLFWLLKTKSPGKLYLIISMSGHDEEAELILRSAYERIKWIPNSETKLLVVDRGMDQETRQICEKVCFDSPGICLCGPDELTKTILH